MAEYRHRVSGETIEGEGFSRMGGIEKEEAKGSGAQGRERKRREEDETAWLGTFMAGVRSCPHGVTAWIRRPQNHPHFMCRAGGRSGEEGRG